MPGGANFFPNEFRRGHYLFDRLRLRVRVRVNFVVRVSGMSTVRVNVWVRVRVRPYSNLLVRNPCVHGLN